MRRPTRACFVGHGCTLNRFLGARGMTLDRLSWCRSRCCFHELFRVIDCALAGPARTRRRSAVGGGRHSYAPGRPLLMVGAGLGGLAIIAAAAAPATDNSWQGATTDWNPPANWSRAAVPDNLAIFTNLGSRSVTFGTGTSTTINTIEFTAAAPALLLHASALG